MESCSIHLGGKLNQQKVFRVSKNKEISLIHLSILVNNFLMNVEQVVRNGQYRKLCSTN